MSRPAVRIEDIGDDEPVTLAEACRLFFGGRLSPSSLRTEAAKGNLVITQIARKDFVTRRDIEDMKEKCRRSASHPDLSSEKKPNAMAAAPFGSSVTERPMSAQDALRIRLRKLNESLPTISRKSSNRRAPVVPLKQP